MQSFSHKALFAIILCSLSAIAVAQQPVLKVDGKDSASVSLSKMKVEVKVIGNYATTSMEMTFCNTSARVLEGELTFPMPEGVSVSRYAIDIDGKLREAVPVEKEKGEVAFENIIRRKVDPALLEKVNGNNFKTRIYPIPANGCRTIVIGYEQLLNAKDNYNFGYNLPLHFKQPLSTFDFAITVATNYIPEVGSDCNTGLKFEELKKVFTASVSKKDFMPDGAFSIAIPKTADAAEVGMQQKNGQYYFLINTFPEVKRIKKEILNNVTIIWDASLSGLNRDHKKELELLEAFFKTKGNLTINLYHVSTQFKKINTFSISNGNWSTLRKTLEDITYDGATDFSTITFLPPADEYLVFTDGLATFGTFDNNLLPKQPVYTINAAAKADYSLLKFVAAKTGGAFINLNEMPIETALKNFTEQTLQFLGIKSNSNTSEVYPSMPIPVVDNCSIAGICNTGTTNITLQFGYGSTVTFEKTIELNINISRTNFVDIEKIWAQKKIAELDILYETNKDEINALGKKYGIVTRNTSLIVLDQISDYVKYGIVPPVELRDKYNEQLKANADMGLLQQINALDEANKYFVDVKKWWNTNFKQVYFKYGEQKNKKGLTDGDGRLDEVFVSTAANQSNTQNLEMRGTRELLRADTANAYAFSDRTPPPPMYDSIAVTAGIGAYSWSGDVNLGKERIKKLEEGIDASISITEQKLDRSYLKELDKITGESKYQKYLELRKGNVTDPVFYFTVAAEFFKAKDTATGYIILSNIADLNLDDDELYKMLGFKLKTIGAFKDEVSIFKKVMQWRPQDPQSYRDYALALADNGQYQNALDTFYFSLTKTYDQEIKSLYPGIEETIITEINNLIAQHGNVLNTSKIDKRLLAQLPVDVRVVLNWNMNATDIDLWVIDPNGEKCFYSHKLTTIGGRISNDFTRGYGPEQFMLKKALKGKYKVMINYYGDTQQKLAGPTTIMTEIYTNYSRPTQERKMITLQMTKTENGEVSIGEFTFNSLGAV